MNFDKQLNIYIEQLDCNSKELADKSGISAPVISRFRTGKKTPNLKTSQLEQLSNGLYLIAKEKHVDLKKDEIHNSLLSTFSDNVDVKSLINNFNELVDVLNINLSSLANSIGFSASLLSKIRSGQRTPYNPHEFADCVCRYVVENYSTDENKETVAFLIDSSIKDISKETAYFNKLQTWLLSNSTPSQASVDNFLSFLDEFDLNEYINSIHFDKLKIPYIPFYKVTSKDYMGTNQIKQAELDFFKATTLSKSVEPVFMCSDMPMDEMSQDINFMKKWMLSVSMILKKGLHINIIHDINRPFKEMMLGLEGWIPLYMTGQVSPYYLKNYKDNSYNHLTYVSGSVALSGESIKGHHSDGKYSLTTNKSDLRYYKRKSKNLLDMATPLMDIYKESDKEQFYEFWQHMSEMNGSSRRRILSSLPTHTIPEKLLLKMLKRNKVSEEDIESILKSFRYEQKIFETILKENYITDEIDEISEEEFKSSPKSLFLAHVFHEKVIKYTYAEYLEHLGSTKQFDKTHKNYTLKINKTNAFKNIQIAIQDNDYVIISKNTSPSIHFVINHPKLRAAIENFIPPVLE